MENLPPPSVSIENASISQLDLMLYLLFNLLTLQNQWGLMVLHGPKLLRNCGLALYIPVHHLLISLSINKHTIPSEWKCRSITPVYKSGDKSQVANYRPISLLCIISKVLERIILALSLL